MNDLVEDKRYANFKAIMIDRYPNVKESDYVDIFKGIMNRFEVVNPETVYTYIKDRDRDMADVSPRLADSPKPIDLESILEDRGRDYGDFSKQAYITQIYKGIQRENQVTKLNASQQEALDMIFGKICRIVNGNPNKKDSWADIAGYATLVANQLKD